MRAGADGVLVFAAASLKTALDEISEGFTDQTGQAVTVSYAASSVLARQIQLGAPADVFISANLDWMDVVQHNGRIDAHSRVDLLGNALVLIGGADHPNVSLTPPEQGLMAALNGGYLAMALVEAVPAGVYGKAALIKLGLWRGVQGQVAQTDNVRAALALVATGAAPLGIVYKTDAMAEQRVTVVAQIPADLHPPIVYPAALTTGAQPDARDFLTYLQSEDARAVFIRQGFTLPGE